jgi:hypothetical protein
MKKDASPWCWPGPSRSEARRNPPLHLQGRGTLRSMVEGLYPFEEPLHRAPRGPPPREIAGRTVHYLRTTRARQVVI